MQISNHYLLAQQKSNYLDKGHSTIISHNAFFKYLILYPPPPDIAQNLPLIIKNLHENYKIFGCKIYFQHLQYKYMVGNIGVYPQSLHTFKTFSKKARTRQQKGKGDFRQCAIPSAYFSHYQIIRTAKRTEKTITFQLILSHHYLLFSFYCHYRLRPQRPPGHLLGGERDDPPSQFQL